MNGTITGAGTGTFRHTTSPHHHRRPRSITTKGVDEARRSHIILIHPTEETSPAPAIHSPGPIL